VDTVETNDELSKEVFADFLASHYTHRD
jgi:hypothetical protein